eukprot:4344206-Pleurochrysis_carterae.AAC.4
MLETPYMSCEHLRAHKRTLVILWGIAPHIAAHAATTKQDPNRSAPIPLCTRPPPSTRPPRPPRTCASSARFALSPSSLWRVRIRSAAPSLPYTSAAASCARARLQRSECARASKCKPGRRRERQDAPQVRARA